MQYPYPNLNIGTKEGTVALEAPVAQVILALRTNSIIPYGDYGGNNVYYFGTFDNGLGNLIYTVFDRETNIGLASFSVRYGAATTIKQALFSPYPRSQIDLQHLILPYIPTNFPKNGSVIP